MADETVTPERSVMHQGMNASSVQNAYSDNKAVFLHQQALNGVTAALSGIEGLATILNQCSVDADCEDADASFNGATRAKLFFALQSCVDSARLHLGETFTFAVQMPANESMHVLHASHAVRANIEQRKKKH